MPRSAPLISTSQAAIALGVSPQRIREYIAEGRLKAYRIGRDWVIDSVSLRKLQHRPAGRPTIPQTCDKCGRTVPSSLITRSCKLHLDYAAGKSSRRRS